MSPNRLPTLPLDGQRFGGQNMVDPLRRVLVKRPDAAFAVDDPARWHYTAAPDLAKAQAEHDALCDTLRRQGVEVIYHDAMQAGRADAVYVFDPALLTDRGAVLLRMGKALRRGEEETLGRCFEGLGIPIVGRLEGEARAEGGDLLWLDEHTLVAGQGFRTNPQGVRQLKTLLQPSGVEVIGVDLPVYSGAEACLHLLSLISLVDHDLAVAYPPLMPVAFYRLLQERGIELLEVSEAEFLTMATNVLALAPRQCLVLEGSPKTAEALQRAGCEVFSYRGEEISLKAEGGPTCLTRPLWRSAD